jgi:membrane-associated protein
MPLILKAIDFILHIDVYLSAIITRFGAWTYGLLFFVIFMETGFVVTPFLPGDSLLFAAGTFAALGALNPWLLFVLMSIAAIAGDTVNYWIGHAIGERAFTGEIKWLKKEYPDPRLLREARRQDHLPGPLRPDRAHLRPLRRRGVRNDVRLFHLL